MKFLLSAATIGYSNLMSKCFGYLEFAVGLNRRKKIVVGCVRITNFTDFGAISKSLASISRPCRFKEDFSNS